MSFIFVATDIMNRGRFKPMAIMMFVLTGGYCAVLVRRQASLRRRRGLLLELTQGNTEHNSTVLGKEERRALLDYFVFRPPGGSVGSSATAHEPVAKSGAEAEAGGPPGEASGESRRETKDVPGNEGAPATATVTEATPDAAASGDEQTPRRHRFLMLASLFRGWGERRARVTAETEESQSTSRPPSQSPSHLDVEGSHAAEETETQPRTSSEATHEHTREAAEAPADVAGETDPSAFVETAPNSRGEVECGDLESGLGGNEDAAEALEEKEDSIRGLRMTAADGECSNHWSTATSCIVCFGEYSYGENLCRLPCKHVFHAKCIDEWLDGSNHAWCPLCKREIASGREDQDESATSRYPEAALQEA